MVRVDVLGVSGVAGFRDAGFELRVDDGVLGGEDLKNASSRAAHVVVGFRHGTTCAGF